MQSVNLKKILLKREILSLLRGLISKLSSPIVIQDLEGKVLVADLGLDMTTNVKHSLENNGNKTVIENQPANKDLNKIPVLLSDEILGWVIGKEQVEQVANFLSYLAKREFEQKMLAADALDKYREINLLYTIASKMSNCLDAKEIGTLVLEEASRLISCTSASVMLHNHHTNCLEIVSAKGTAEQINSLNVPANVGIAGYVFTTGKSELVNDAMQDPRYIINENECYAIICAPILTKDRTIGVVNISNSEPISYTSQDLKLFTAIVTQASGAIENAILHESKLREQRIKNNLERYLSPQVAEAVINEKEEVSLTTSKRKIAMLFSDIRNFTTKCEELEPEQLVDYLNEYFTQMVDVIFNHQGPSISLWAI